MFILLSKKKKKKEKFPGFNVNYEQDIYIYFILDYNVFEPTKAFYK